MVGDAEPAESFDAEGELELIRDFVPTAATQSLFERLLDDIEWSQHAIALFGRSVSSPRLTALLGDPGLSYRYSGHRHEVQPWPAAARGVLQQVSTACGVGFNSALANLYRDGRDSVGWHSDDERDLGPAPVIASLSLGATRRFSIKPREGGKASAVELPAGSLLILRAGFQQRYRHAVLNTARPVGPRINLTFRRLVVP